MEEFWNEQFVASNKAQSSNYQGGTSNFTRTVAGTEEGLQKRVQRKHREKKTVTRHHKYNGHCSGTRYYVHFSSMESEQDKIDFAKSIDRIIKMWDHKNGIIEDIWSDEIHFAMFPLCIL